MIDRRTFVGRCLFAASLSPALVTGCASLVVRRVQPVNGRIQLPLSQYPELLEADGTLRLQPEGMSDPIYVLSAGENQFVALSPICTHLACTVEIERDRLVCPCHGSTYDRRGAVLKGPAEQPLHRYRTQLTADHVLNIELNENR